MAHIILTGATGLCGSAILAHALQSPAISRISILSRRPVALAANESKANVIIHKDFSEYPQEVLDQLKGASACIWAQGISSRGMSEKAYEEITVHYPLAAAKAFASAAAEGGVDGNRMVFVYISGTGAQLDESKASMMFGRVKGRAEKQLLELQDSLPALKVYSLRPATINNEGRNLAERKLSAQDWLSNKLGNVMEKVAKGYVISTSGIANASIRLALGDGKPLSVKEGTEADGRVLSNAAIRLIGGPERQEL